MAVIDLRPEVVDLLGYAGDTITLLITVDPPELVTGAAWAAQVREPRDSSAVLKEFTVQPWEAGAYLTLSAADTAALWVRAVEEGTLRKSRTSSRAVAAWAGEWDVQISRDGSVRTLAQGRITVEQDVTR